MASYPHLCTTAAHVEMAIATLHSQAAGECSTTYHHPPAAETASDQQRQASIENKRKQEAAGGRRKKHRRSGDAVKEAKEVEKKLAMESPSGYIHVRARRGQATDSHSLAERVRREKIRERMRLLQELVPGCDKVTGKALMLDEIINYVQSLQSQVEFLSMKLASVNPIMWDIGLDDYYFEQEAVDMAPSVASPSQQAAHVHPTAFAVAANSHPILDNSYPLLLLGQGYNSGV